MAEIKPTGGGAGEGVPEGDRKNPAANAANPGNGRPAGSGAQAADPLLVLVHGTGRQEHDYNEVYLQALHYGYYDEPVSSDVGDSWWQTDSEFFRRLSRSIRARDGKRLDSEAMVFRLKWSGANLESERQAAAHHLSFLYDKAAPRRLHFVAHSHGGNVVRSAIEDLARSGKDLGRFGAVISLGTPFFTYSTTRKLRNGAAGLVLGLLLIAAGYGAFNLYFRPDGLDEWTAWRLALVPVIAFCGMMGFFIALEGLIRLRRPRRGGRLGRGRINWTNFCSSYDEAVQLLRSFERPLPMLQRLGHRTGGLAWAGLVFAMGVTVAVLIFGAAGEWAKRSDLHIFAISMLWLAMVVLLYQPMRAARDFLTTGTSRLFDGLVSARLRNLAYGDDDWSSVSGISTIPWEDHPEAHVPVGDAVEAEIEGWISSATAGLWGRMRKAMRADGSLIEADFRYLIEEVLSGDELAHTCYYRVPRFLELVADRLVATGDYVRTSESERA